MANEKERQFYDLLYLLRRQFFTGVATCSNCSKNGCEETVRGAGHCEKCLTEDIAELTGDATTANMLTGAMIVQNNAVNRLLEKLEDK